MIFSQKFISVILFFQLFLLQIIWWALAGAFGSLNLHKHFITHTRMHYSGHNRTVDAVLGWFFNETLKYNLWILMSYQMMPKRWFSIIINTEPEPWQQHEHQTGLGPSLVSGRGRKLVRICRKKNKRCKRNSYTLAIQWQLILPHMYICIPPFIDKCMRIY